MLVFLHDKLGLVPTIKDKNNVDACWIAAYRGDIRAYKYLKTWGCVGSNTSYKNETILFEAVRSGSLQMV